MISCDAGQERNSQQTWHVDFARYICTLIWIFLNLS